MKGNDWRALVLSDFNVETFVGYLNNSEDSPKVRGVSAPFGQVLEVLINEKAECWKNDLDLVIVWTQPQGVIQAFKRFLNFEGSSIDEVLSEVEQFSHALQSIQERARAVMVPTWSMPIDCIANRLLDMKSGVGIGNTLARMNLRLVESLEKLTNYYVLNAPLWFENSGKSASTRKFWYLAKVPFGNEVFKECARDIKSALRGISGEAKKLVVVDLDDTLWGGIVGEVGWEQINLGGHNYIGEAFVDFQMALKVLLRQGFLLGIVSKNQEDVALEAIKKHPEMILGIDDFAGWKINWKDKAENILDLVSQLNLGVESVVFIDDNPVERARVREAIPQVFVPEWPEDPTEYRSALFSLRCFEVPSISEEDRRRTQMYVSEQRRDNLRVNAGSLEEWLKSLEIVVRVETLSEGNLQRASQLFNKTNQMNLSTRRMTDMELMEWARMENQILWTIRVSDRFGDSGLTGIASLEVENGQKGRIRDFLLSCRVMGRKVEEAMLHTIVKHARSIGLPEVCAEYSPTSKNKPCLEFWKQSGFICDDGSNWFRWDSKREYPAPEILKIEE